MMNALLNALQQCPILGERGLNVTAEDATTVIIRRGVHVRGVWKTTGGMFEFYFAGSAEAKQRVSSLDEVRAVTEKVFERRIRPRS